MIRYENTDQNFTGSSVRLTPVTGAGRGGQESERLPQFAKDKASNRHAARFDQVLPDVLEVVLRFE
jgi:hypothetical protein